MSKKELLLIDTNIISHALTPTQTVAYAALFKELENNYIFVVTGFTKYELLCSSSKKHREGISDYIENEMVYVELSDVLMNFSARIHNLYRTHKSTKHLTITTGDIINASFSIAKNCPLLTIDNNDYPRPFFIDVDRKRVEYESTKSRAVMDTVYILKPDMENIKVCCKEYNI